MSHLVDSGRQHREEVVPGRPPARTEMQEVADFMAGYTDQLPAPDPVPARR